MIPLMIDFAGKRVVIFGGGEVGARKARFFSPEAEVTVISRSFSPGLSGLEIQCVTEELSDLHDEEMDFLLDGVFLAVAATTDTSLNNRIGTACRRRGILFNNASGEPGDTLIPSVMCGEHFLLAVSTGGESPAVSRFLREYLQSAFPDLDRMVVLQDRLRTILSRNEPDSWRRKDLVTKVLHDPAVWAALAKGEETAWQIVEEKYLQ
ncbi:MAG: bifunctional precorrin-2 dehydrogenase/sirohydrochlorin ferrochelatase [Methanoregulaceae archaeon]|nr:bifunctional precorrin-2 dehydrogenase/sirohydrochlorin ferrochelatase [Methanoregulaceae archaeon]